MESKEMSDNKRKQKDKSEEIIQVKSKERVKDFGEVFTNPREVKAMLDLVKDESYRIEATFLEPACGTGNFLVEILDRKLKTVSEVAKDKSEWVNLALVAVGAIYGIDIQKDNVEESIERLLTIVESKCVELYESFSENEKNAFEFIMKENIIHGNGLTGMLCKTNGEESKRELMFSEWDFSKLNSDNIVTRKLFSMNKMIDHNKKIEADKKIASQAGSLFALATPAVPKKEEEMKPQRIEALDNFLKKTESEYSLFTLISKFLVAVSTYNDSNLKSNDEVTLKFQQLLNKINKKLNNFHKNISVIFENYDIEKFLKMMLIFEKLGKDKRFISTNISDIEISILDEMGNSDKMGNFFLAKNKVHGYKTKIFKIDDSIPGKYKGPKESIFNFTAFATFSGIIITNKDDLETMTLESFFELLKLLI